MDPRIHPITDTLFFIQRGWLNANHFVQVKPEIVLVDTGYLPHWPETEALISATGARIADTRTLIATHAHCDHVGGNAIVAAESGCTVRMHEIDRHFMEQQNNWASWSHYYDQEAQPFPVHASLAEGECIRLGGPQWQVLHAPGHSMGQICLFAPDTGWLISADAAWDGDFGVLTTRIEGMDAPFRQRDTLDRLARLPVTTIYPGHGAVIADGRAAIEKCRERIALFLENPRRMAMDQVRKIMLYLLMMKGPLTEKVYLSHIQQSIWFPEVCATYFLGPGENVFKKNLAYLQERGLILSADGELACTLTA
jgi:hydroxyacylglutathione hydrolase